MLHFKHPTTGQVFAYENVGERNKFGDPELVKMTEQELAQFLTPAPAGVPQSVTRFQARAALHLAGLLPQVEALMSDPATDALARLAWTDAQEFRRESPTVLGMAASLGLNPEQIDALFTVAAGIEA